MVKKEYETPEVIEIEMVCESLMNSSSSSLFSNKAGVNQGESEYTVSENNYWSTRRFTDSDE